MYRFYERKKRINFLLSFFSFLQISTLENRITYKTIFRDIQTSPDTKTRIASRMAAMESYVREIASIKARIDCQEAKWDAQLSRSFRLSSRGG